MIGYHHYATPNNAKRCISFGDWGIKDDSVTALLRKNSFLGFLSKMVVY